MDYIVFQTWIIYTNGVCGKFSELAENFPLMVIQKKISLFMKVQKFFGICGKFTRITDLQVTK